MANSQYYRHFKGNIYKLICIANDSETLEKNNSRHPT